MHIEINGESRVIPPRQIMGASNEEFECVYQGCELSIHMVDGGWNVDFVDEDGDGIIQGFYPFVFGTRNLRNIKLVIELCIEKIV